MESITTDALTLVIPSYRNHRYLELCLRSAVTFKRNPTTTIIVVIDGYPEESQTVIDMFPEVQSIILPENKGMQYALNMGVMHAETSLVMIANDDNVFSVAWDILAIEEFRLATLNAYRLVLSINQIEPTGPSIFDFPIVDCGQTVDTFNMTQWVDTEQTHRSSLQTYTGAIFPFVILKRYYMAVGGFDTFYDSPNWCDVDFFLKLELLDFTFIRTHAFSLYHFGSVSTKRNIDAPSFRQKELVAAQVFEYKWGFRTPILANTRHGNSKLPHSEGRAAIRGLG